MASGHKAASSCSPLALERGLSGFVGRRLLLLLSYVTLLRGARSFFCAGFVKLRWPRGEWKLALGSGSWVGGIEIETFDELCCEKIYVSKSLNPKP